MSTFAATLPAKRISVSLRLPESIVSTISAYAEEHSLHKTDAFIHFLELGIASPNRDTNDQVLDQIRTQTAEILALLKSDSSEGGISRETVLSAIASAAKEYPAISQAFLFGSFARSMQSPTSDVDVQLVLDRNERFNLRDLSRFAKKIEEATQRECDIVTVDTIEDEGFAKNLHTERILAYERPQQ